MERAIGKKCQNRCHYVCLSCTSRVRLYDPLIGRHATLKFSDTQLYLSLPRRPLPLRPFRHCQPFPHHIPSLKSTLPHYHPGPLRRQPLIQASGLLHSALPMPHTPTKFANLHPTSTICRPPSHSPHAFSTRLSLPRPSHPLQRFSLDCHRNTHTRSNLQLPNHHATSQLLPTTIRHPH